MEEILLLLQIQALLEPTVFLILHHIHRMEIPMMAAIYLSSLDLVEYRPFQPWIRGQDLSAGIAGMEDQSPFLLFLEILEIQVLFCPIRTPETEILKTADLFLFIQELAI